MVESRIIMKAPLAIAAALLSATTFADQYRLKSTAVVEIIDHGSVIGTKTLKAGTIVTPTVTSSEPEASSSIESDIWDVSTKSDPITDAKSYILASCGENADGKGHFNCRPYLVIRITPKRKKLEGSIYFTERFEMFEESSSVQLRLDGDPSFSVSPSAADSKDALFLPNNTISKLYGHTKLTIRAATFNSSRTFTFTVTGIKEIVEKIKQSM